MNPDRQNIFRQVNNGLILVLFFVIGFLFFSQQNIVNSQAPSGESDLQANPSIPAYLINTELQVSIEPGNMTAHFVSDGASGKPDDVQKSKFTNGSGLGLIDIPIDYNFVPEESKLQLPGELVYPAIRKPTAPTTYVCKERDPNDKVNEANCFFNVTSLSMISSQQSTSVTVGDQEYAVQPVNDSIFNSIVGILKSAFAAIDNIVATNTGTPDQSRSAVGSTRFWGDDSYQQFVPISGGGQGSQAILQGKAKTDSTGNNISEGLFASEFSAGLNGQIATRYKQTNVVKAQMDRIVGAGEIYEPFTSFSAGTPTAEQQFDIGEFLLQKITSSNQTFAQKQEKLAVQVALRPLRETDSYGAKYRFCDALSAVDALNGFDPYPNPYGTNQSEYTNVQTDPTGRVVSRQRNPKYDPWKRYEDRNISVKKCISAVAAYVDDIPAKECAQSYADNVQGSCDEFSVEEDNLHLSMMEKSLPIGLGAYFQNAVLSDLDPSNTSGPYLNYLSPYFCGKLSLVYQLKAGKSYMYNVSGKGEGSSGSKAINQYCVLGGLISNFSWALAQQDKNFSTTNFGTINIPKEALTCDKKETAIFGATKVVSNNVTANNELVYITEDNSRGAFDTKDDVGLYNNYNNYSLSYIFNNVVKNSPFKYGNNFDIQPIIDPVTNTPKYVTFTTANNSESQSLYLCKIPADQLAAVPKEVSLCKVIDTGGFVVNTASAIQTTYVPLKGTSIAKRVDTIVVAYSDFPSAEAADSKDPVPIIYRYIDVIDDNDISRSIVGAKQTLPYNTNMEMLQLKNQRGILIANFQNQKGSGLAAVKVIKLDPAQADFIQNEDGSGKATEVIGVNHKYETASESPNLCEGNNYCSTLSKLQFIYRMKLAEDSQSAVSYLAVTASGMGVVWQVNNSDASKAGDTMIFAFKPSSSTNIESDDYILSMKVNAERQIDMFLSRGYYLRLIFPSRITNSSLAQKTLDACGTNCLITVQKEFNTSTFTTDCSDYKGSGVCGFAKMNELKQPQVFAFTYSPTNRILAWYTQEGIDKTILRSPDMLYSFSGVYSRIGDTSEYSNAYVPQLQSVDISENQKAFAPQATPFRIYDFSNDGLTVGSELQDLNGVIVENPNLNLEKLNCLQIYNSRVSGIDVYFNDTGLSTVDINPVTTYTKSNRNTSSNGSMSSQNSGQFCEETWCVPDSVSLVDNPKWAGDKDDTDLKNKILDFLSNGDSQRRQAYNNPEVLGLACPSTGKACGLVDYICDVASNKQISCALMIGIWYQESSASIQRINNTAFGCFNNTTTFADQVECATNTVRNRYREFTPGGTLSGPSAADTPMNNGVVSGKCEPATKFSHLMNRYTPTDRRINVDNQCNRGLVTRDDQDLAGCEGDYAPTNADSNNDYGVYWPRAEASATRITLQKALIAMDDRLQAENNLCYPASATSTGETSADIQQVIKDYDFSYTKNPGSAAINLAKGWGGTDWASGNVYMLMKEDWQNAKDPDDVGFEGAFIVKPGASFSFLDEIQALGGRNIKDLESKYSNIQPPWSNSTFNFTGGEQTPGGGWCEFFTTWYVSATELVGADGTKLVDNKRESLENGKVLTYHSGDIEFRTHTWVPSKEGFNKMGVEGTQIASDGDFVAVSTPDGPEFKLNNPYKNPDDPDLVIFVTIDNESTIRVVTQFGKKKAPGGTIGAQ